MKTLYLVRHAKSSWKNTDLSDMERPLNKRGKNDASFMGNVLRENKVLPEFFVSSNAVRAKKTAYAFANELNYEKDNIVLTNKIYEASALELFDFIKNLDQKHNSVMMFGHNPSLTNLHNFLTDHYIDNIPTCGVVGIEFDTKWENIEERSGRFLFLVYPKMYKA